GDHAMGARDNMIFAGIGWLAGICLMLAIGFVIFPALDGVRRPCLGMPDVLILGLVLLLVTPFALAGGLVGARLPREGGRNSQLIMAAICGILLAVPLSCLVFWYSGW
ncbi:MAG TPA: hypothetical protein VFX76_15545, partial [Roseiflexaceae bacterium]|nr:hypothetical protein [Roseiflexaceae bacterium]